MSQKQSQEIRHVLEMCHAALEDAAYTEDGLSTHSAEAVLQLIRDTLGYDPRGTNPTCGSCGKTLGDCRGH